MQPKVTFISKGGPYLLEPGDPESVEFFPPRGLAEKQAKQEMADLIGRVSSLYFKDPYGVMWVLDQVE